ncbi:MAG: hypothetical protein QF732_09015 [Nitrospinaceae bacterium]|nr:hypothetical protein [Nitrospinaceae bacterium]
MTNNMAAISVEEKRVHPTPVSDVVAGQWSVQIKKANEKRKFAMDTIAEMEDEHERLSSSNMEMLPLDTWKVWAKVDVDP